MVGGKQVLTMLNQGYSLDVTPGWLGAIGTGIMGPAEREEVYRSELINALCDERLKRDKKKKDDDDDEMM